MDAFETWPAVILGARQAQRRRERPRSPHEPWWLSAESHQDFCCAPRRTQSNIDHHAKLAAAPASSCSPLPAPRGSSLSAAPSNRSELCEFSEAAPTESEAGPHSAFPFPARPARIPTTGVPRSRRSQRHGLRWKDSGNGGRKRDHAGGPEHGAQAQAQEAALLGKHNVARLGTLVPGRGALLLAVFFAWVFGSLRCCLRPFGPLFFRVGHGSFPRCG